MPKIQDASPTAIFDLIDIAVIDEWDTFPGERVVAIPFGKDVNNQSFHNDIRKRIFTAAAEITKSQKTVVAGLRPHEHAKPNASPPHTFLIYNLTELQHRTLLERAVWSSADITFRVALPLPTQPDFLFSITGLSTLATDNVRDMVLNTWQKREILLAVQDVIKAPNNQNPPTTTDALGSFLNSVELKRLDIKEKKGALAPEFNVYADARYIQNSNVWDDLRNILASQEYHSTIVGQGSVRPRPFNCKVCHGVDHPSGLCPFPNIPGWKGPDGTESDKNRNGRNEGNRGPAMRQGRR